MRLYDYIYINTRKTSNTSRSATRNLTTDQTGAFSSTLTRDVPVPVNAPTEELDDIPLSEVQGFKEPALPPRPNCSASRSSTKAFGISVDDSVLEQQATFVARSILPLQAVGRTTLLKI